MSTRDLADYLALRYPAAVQERSDGGFFVTHPDLDGCMAEGDTLIEAFANLADAKELWIETRLAHGYPVPEPTAAEETYSGRISLRMDPALHARLVKISERKDISLNLLINTVLASFAGGEDSFYEAAKELKDDLRQIAALLAGLDRPLKRPAPPRRRRVGGVRGSAR
jgi:antitoxin HicB